MLQFNTKKQQKIMKILKMILKEGIISLMPETFDDLWHIQKILENGDIITAKTIRKTIIKRGQETMQGDRRPVTLTIKLDKHNLDENGLKLTGEMISAPESFEKGYHSIHIIPGKILKIQKEWKKHQIDRLKKARVKEPLIFICVIDREQADFACLLESGIKLLGSIFFKRQTVKKISRKETEEKREEFYIEVMNCLEKQEKCKNIVLAGPGFEYENLYKFIKKRKPKLTEKIITEHASSTGRTGIQEIVKKSINKILTNCRITRETKIIEELLKEIKSDGLVVYGKKETEDAVNLNAVKTLLVSDKYVQEYEGLMNKIEKQRGEIIIISSEHENGEMFLSIGGIAGFLRFKIK